MFKKIGLFFSLLFILQVPAISAEDDSVNNLDFDINKTQKGYDIGQAEKTYMDNVKAVDWGDYMDELHQRIISNWTPPEKSYSVSETTVLVNIQKNGELISYQIRRSSGLEKYDKTVIEALKKTFPYNPLPEKYAGESVQIEFTFDYDFVI